MVFMYTGWNNLLLANFPFLGNKCMIYSEET